MTPKNVGDQDSDNLMLSSSGVSYASNDQEGGGDAYRGMAKGNYQTQSFGQAKAEKNLYKRASAANMRPFKYEEGEDGQIRVGANIS
jgi:hypothetical protein